MPIIDWPAKIVNIDPTELVLLQSTPTYIYQLDMDWLRKSINDLMDGDQGMAWPTVISHNPPVSVSGAVLSRVVEFINDYTVTFTDGKYRVQVVGANTNIGDVTNVNQVSVSTSNSAGLQDLNSLQAASYGGYVTVDTGSIYTGTVFPVGTRGFPVNNLLDAHAIVEDHGLNLFLIRASMTIDNTAGLDPDGYEFFSDNPGTTTVTIDPSAEVTNAVFRDISVTGTLDGNNMFRDCFVGTINYVNGVIFRCGIQANATITLGGNAQASILDSFSMAADSVADDPTVDMNGAGNSLVVRDFSGGLNLRNMTGAADEVSLDFNSGRLTIDSTVTAGTIVVRGVCEVTDNSNGATVVDNTVSHDAETSRKLLENRQELVDTGPDVRIRTYEDDGTTVFKENVVTDKDDQKPDLTGIIKRGTPQ